MTTVNMSARPALVQAFVAKQRMLEAHLLRDRAIREAHAAGASLREIAAYLGMSPGSVFRVVDAERRS